tara:strand:- start:4871 stop:5209 length:339 start_codon:yes stop_codon:yes gene_type:complete
MFRDLFGTSEQSRVNLLLDDDSIIVPAGYTVAAAILVHHRRHSRTSAVSGVPRGPFCLMGGCFECLVEIDGVSNRQACMVEVQNGMKVCTQKGPGELLDVMKPNIEANFYEV